LTPMRRPALRGTGGARHPAEKAGKAGHRAHVR
jgi:hypothetical protein